MSLPVVQLVREMFTGSNRRPTIALLTTAVCLAAWYAVGNYNFWSRTLAAFSTSDNSGLHAACWSWLSSVLLLGIVPLLVVKFVLHERLADYGIRLGDLRFALICCALAAPLIVVIGYSTAQSPAFQAVYPTNPLARQSSTVLIWHLAAQFFWYAAWEFHFRGFLQRSLEASCGISTAIWVQTLASTLAHFGKPGAEVFGSIIGGMLWGALAWRTRSLLASTIQHWLLGASLDFFIFSRFQSS